MNFHYYQLVAQKTAVYPGAGEFAGLAYVALGLNGEAGEVAEKVKKLWRDNGVLDETTRAEISAELGDVLWYLAAVAREIDVDLNTIAEQNLDKLRDRSRRNALSGSGDNR